MNIVIPKPVNEVLNLLYEKDYDGYITGGAIRNMVMEEKPKNYNISTNASLEEVKKCLKGYNTFLKGENKSTLGIVNTKFPMEITKYKSKANTLESDLQERDFTMNALAYSDEDGLIDYFDGIKDINNKEIKVIGNAEERFAKEPIIMLRAIRLSSEYDMAIDQDTKMAMFECAELLKKVKPESLKDEFDKLLVSHNGHYSSAYYIKKYFEIMINIIPELSLMEGFEQENPHELYDVLNHTMLTVKSIEPTLELRLAMLLHDIAKPLTFEKNENGVGTFKNRGVRGAEIAREIMRRMHYSNKQVQKVAKLIEYLEEKVPEKEQDLKRFINSVGPENVEDLFKCKRANFAGQNTKYSEIGNRIDEDYERVKKMMRKSSFITKNELKIDGHDLLDLGVEQENVGNTLQDMYVKVLGNELKNKREKLIDYVINKVIVPNDQKELNKKVEI